jgi:flagellar hook assembly protein FlgD
MMYNDYTWGSNSITPPYHPTNDGGQVMFAELQIVFPVGQPMDSDDVTVTPTTSLLNQNYPNPFNPETTISFNIPAATNGSLNVYNVKGQLVKTLVNGPLAFGSHSFGWNGTANNGSAVSSGVYYYRLTAGSHSETKKMVLVK